MFVRTNEMDLAREKERLEKEERFRRAERRRERRTAERMSTFHESGVISDEIMVLYGVSGDMPDRDAYRSMSPEAREALWTERMERKLGVNWRERFRRRQFVLPTFLQKGVAEYFTHNWLKEGF